MSRTGLPGLKVGLMIPVGSWQKATSPRDLFRGRSVVVLPSGQQQKLLIILSCELKRFPRMKTEIIYYVAVAWGDKEHLPLAGTSEWQAGRCPVRGAGRISTLAADP